MSLIGLLNYLDQRSGREQYGNLLNEYRVPGDPNQLPLGNTPGELDQAIQRQQGGFRGEGGLISGGPPQEFYMRAAALPGYQQLAQQAQQGQIQMQLQQQNQQWQQENLTAGQKATLEANRFTEEMRYTRPTYYEAAQLSVRREELAQQDWARRQSVAQGWAGNAIRRDEFNANYMRDPNNPKGFVPRPQIPAGYTPVAGGGVAPMEGYTKPQTAEQAKATAGLQTMLPALETINAGKGNLGTTEAALAAVPVIGPTLAKWSQSGPEGKQRAAEGVFAANYIHAMSGAAASEAEVKRLTDSIFARPGDNAAALAQKKANREAIVAGQNILTGSARPGSASKDVKVFKYNPKTGVVE